MCSFLPFFCCSQLFLCIFLGKTKQKTFYFLPNWNSQDLNFEHIEVGKQTLPLGYHHIVRRWLRRSKDNPYYHIRKHLLPSHSCDEIWYDPGWNLCNCLKGELQVVRNIPDFGTHMLQTLQQISQTECASPVSFQCKPISNFFVHRFNPQGKDLLRYHPKTPSPCGPNSYSNSIRSHTSTASYG